LLIGEQGLILRRVAESGGNGRNVAATIGWLKENFRRSVQVEDLAKMAGMSVSSFHKHFRALTAMSPLQFLKKLRLIEARRLMLAERRDAADAAFEVGYESPSQFSREYARLFGAPPSRDVKNLLRSSTD
ncbi:MAG: AraC family transcriptional regulator, partial [Deltaproteobacteria bacterium]|nr:AraC family transcriptional regulator [Deltaproteobacteria bacterium]